ncbi:MAG: hypothetical protein KA196_02770 [Arenimonas sp.]|nr:hypothetical protein [Arenimonas sp.]
MTRLLLALCLALPASAALANDAPPAAVDAPACIKPDTKPGKSADSADGAGSAQPGTPAPVRPRSGGRGTPRWHSMLPGMIR